MSGNSYKFAITEMVRLRDLDLTQPRFETFNALMEKGDLEKAYQALVKAISLRSR